MTSNAIPLTTKPLRQENFWDSRLMRRFRRNTLALVGLFIVLSFAVLAIFAPLFAPPTGNCIRDLNVPEGSSVYNPVGPMFWKAIFVPPPSCYLIFRPDVDLGAPTPPGSKIMYDGKEHTMVLGKNAGYDVWYGLVWGTRTSFKLALSVTFITLILGLVVGGVAGYFGGWIDNAIMRFIDIVYALPNLILTVVLISLLKPSLATMIFAFSVLGWTGFARILRGDILKVRNLEFVEGARALGASDWKIIFRHVIPNALSTFTVVVVLALGSLPLSAASISFLGLGLPPGYADWGQVFSFARFWIVGPAENKFAYWYVPFFPAITIVLWGLGWNLLGDALRDALDPRER